MEKLLDCGKVSCPWKSSLTVKKYLDQGKITFMTAEKIVNLIILKANARVETMKIYIFSLEQTLSLLTFFAVEKISPIFSKRLKDKY